MRAHVSRWLMNRCLDLITSRWSPIAFCGRWYGNVTDAWIKEVILGRPVTWADLNPFAGSRPSEPARLQGRGES